MPLIPVTLTAREERTSDISVLHFMPQAAFAFDAGQYVEVIAPDFEPRPFSLANAPRKNNAITLHVRDLGQGLSRFLCRNLNIGDTVQIEGPHGHMHSKAATAKPVFMIGGGTGVVPLLAIAEDIVRKGLSEDGMVLIYGVRLEDDIHCRKELDTLAASGELSVHYAIGAETPDKILTRLAPKLALHTVYMSGLDPMLFNILPSLKAHGMKDNALHTDADLQVLMGLPS